MNTEDYSDYIHDAIESVTAWDVPDEYFAQAVNDQAKLMAGITPENFREPNVND